MLVRTVCLWPTAAGSPRLVPGSREGNQPWARALGRLPCAGFSKFRSGRGLLILIFFSSFGRSPNRPPKAVPRTLLREFLVSQAPIRLL